MYLETLNYSNFEEVGILFDWSAAATHVEFSWIVWHPLRINISFAEIGRESVGNYSRTHTHTHTNIHIICWPSIYPSERERERDLAQITFITYYMNGQSRAHMIHRDDWSTTIYPSSVHESLNCIDRASGKELAG